MNQILKMFPVLMY